MAPIPPEERKVGILTMKAGKGGGFTEKNTSYSFSTYGKRKAGRSLRGRKTFPSLSCCLGNAYTQEGGTGPGERKPDTEAGGWTEVSFFERGGYGRQREGRNAYPQRKKGPRLEGTVLVPSPRKGNFRYE